MQASLKLQQAWLEQRRSQPHKEELNNYKYKSATLTRSKQELFPTITLLPKRLMEVERCYESLARTARQSPVSAGKLGSGPVQFDKIKLALREKIAEKHLRAVQLRKQESKVRWAVEREVKLKQKLEQERVMREEIERSLAEVYLAQLQGRKNSQLDSVQRRLRVSHQQSNAIYVESNPQEKNTRGREKKKEDHQRRSQSEKLLAERQRQQIEQLKAQLREQCVQVLQKEDSINSYLFAFRRKV